VIVVVIIRIETFLFCHKVGTSAEAAIFTDCTGCCWNFLRDWEIT